MRSDYGLLPGAIVTMRTFVITVTRCAARNNEHCTFPRAALRSWSERRTRKSLKPPIKLGQTKIKIRAKASELAALQFSGRTVAWVRLRLLKLATVNDVHRKNPPFTTAESGKSVPFPVLYDPNC